MAVKLTLNLSLMHRKVLNINLLYPKTMNEITMILNLMKIIMPTITLTYDFKYYETHDDFHIMKDKIHSNIYSLQ